MSSSRPKDAVPDEGSSNERETQGSRSRERTMYARFGAMIATSVMVMYGLTYTNLFDLGHARWSAERAYMAVVMGCGMAVVMLAFMWGMYKNARLNVLIVVGAVIVGGSAFTMSQTQALVGDQAYMKGMVPHHSIAILTSEQATIEDLRVVDLADGISDTQVEEIKEMDWLLDDIAENGTATTPQEAAARPVPDFTGEVEPYLRDHESWIPLLHVGVTDRAR